MARAKKGKSTAKNGSSQVVMWVVLVGGAALLLSLGVVAVKFILPALRQANPTVAQGSNAVPTDPSAATAAGGGTGTMAPVSGQTRAALNPQQELIEKKRLAKRHLEIIGLNFQNIESIHNHLPPIATTSQPKAGEVPQSWMCDILPFDEAHRATYNSINRREEWTSPVNAGPFQTVVSGFLNPAAQVGIKNAQGYALAHFAANSRVVSHERYLSRSDIKDGASNVMLAGSITDGFKAWGDPTNHRDASKGFGGGADAFGAPHEGRAIILMADGSVREVRADLSPEISARIADPADGQVTEIPVLPE